MAQSLSSPWIRDYLVDVAETYGAQIYNAPISSGKKKVQLTDFLTYQDSSYVWAWISDKDYKVSVRISEDAASAYKSQHNRNVIDCRFSVLVISNYRPMFSRRPLGPNATGNTPVSHISLEIGQVKLLGIGGHLFGNPRDLELDENVKEWVHGLRQDGGGGNVLKLRKQELAQNKKAGPSPPSPPPFSLCAPVSQCPATSAPEQITKPNSEQPQDLKRAYAKRWRIIEVNSWRFATKPIVEPPNLYPTPHRTPSPTPRLQRQGTPTDWSPSIRGSPVNQDKATTVGFENETQPHDEPEVLPTTPRLPSDTEGHATMDTVTASETHSLQPPTPAQRIKRSPSPRSTSLSRSSPEVHARSSPFPFQQLPCSSPLPPSSSLPLPSSSLPIPVGIRNNIQRKVPHPGLPVVRPDSAEQGPVQILVPNSDISGAGSSQFSQSLQSRCQLAPHPPAFPSSLATDFEPLHASTPREGKPNSPTRRASKTSAESLPTHRNADGHETTPTDVKQSTEKLEINAGKQGESNSTRPPAPSAPKVEVLEVGTSDNEEADQLQLTRSTQRTEAGFDAQSGTQEMGAVGATADDEGNHISVEKVEVQSAPQSGPSSQPTKLPAAAVVQRQPSNEHIPQMPELPGSQSSMRSLFSVASENEQIVSSHAPVVPVDRNEGNAQENAGPSHVPSHDPEAWKVPSFLARKKAKGKARVVEERDVDTPNVKASKKHWRSVQPESPVRKRAKAAGPEVHQMVSGKTNTTSGKVPSNNRPSASSTDTTETTTPSTALQSSKPRLANFVVDFERIDLGKRVSIPMVDVDKDIENTLLRTGRIRTLGNEMEKDGSVYIKR